MRITILITMLALTACASIEPKPFKGPNGGQAYSMVCSGMGRTMDQCFQKAGEVCPSGYTIIDRDSSIIMAGGMIAPRHALAIECK